MYRGKKERKEIKEIRVSLELSWWQHTVEQLIYSKPSDINHAEVGDNESHTEQHIQS